MENNLFQIVINGYTLNIRPEDIRSWDVSIKGDHYPELFEIHPSGRVSPPENPDIYNKTQSQWGQVVKVSELETPQTYDRLK
jgi:hypothetical protein